MSALLEVSALSVVRGDHELFDSLNFALEGGEIMLIEGPNGSGKTSLLKCVAGLIPAESGEIRWQGSATASDPQGFRASVAWFAHKNGFKSELSARQNLEFEAQLRSRPLDQLSSALEQVGLTSIAERPFKTLSAGQQRRVGLARMLLAGARLWILDEPFTNLDEQGQALTTLLSLIHI